jgi:hypothetical protein
VLVVFVSAICHHDSIHDGRGRVFVSLCRFVSGLVSSVKSLHSVWSVAAEYILEKKRRGKGEECETKHQASMQSVQEA